MHTKRLYAVKADDVDEAISFVENELYNDSRTNENNFFNVNGAIDVKNNKYTCIDADREWHELTTVEGVIKFMNEHFDKKRYEQNVEQLKLSTEREDWFNVERIASELDNMHNVIEDGFTLNDQYVTEVASGKIDTFGIDNWYEANDHKPECGSYLVVVDFHF